MRQGSTAMGAWVLEGGGGASGFWPRLAAALICLLHVICVPVMGGTEAFPPSLWHVTPSFQGPPFQRAMACTGLGRP